MINTPLRVRSYKLIGLKNKIGQMLIVGFHGCEIHDKSPIAQWLSEYGLGGVLLFDKDHNSNTYGKNLKNEGQIKQLIRQLNHYASVLMPKEEQLPLLTAIDYEGGAVDRLRFVEGCLPTMTAAEMAKLSERALIDELTQMALTLKSLGFNLNFAPVVDLNLTNEEGIIGKLQRSFSADPKEVTRVARQFVNVFSAHGIACAYKHFPGHGSAKGDTHEGFVDVTETYQDQELIPYRELICDKEQPVMIMTAHVINKNLDAQGLPATLSHPILTGILRQQLGFGGVIISDDLQMQAIASHYSLEHSLELTINAGANMLIIANQLGQHTAPEVIDSIEKLVLEGKIDRQLIDDSFRRIMRLKQQLNCCDIDL